MTVYSSVQMQVTPLKLECEPMASHGYLLFFLFHTEVPVTLVR